MKRLFDVAVSLTMLVISLPVLLLIAMLVRINLGSPLLFRQQRPGWQGKPFYIYKFRTMRDARDAEGELLPDAERLPSFGQFLRKYSLDELPQLYNVIRGDISMVGPRALLMEYLPLYSEDQARRHYVKPGITGWAQINGRNAISWEDKFKCDVWYVDNHSFLLDMKILWMTLLKVVKPEGITQAGHASMEKFKGSSQ